MDKVKILFISHSADLFGAEQNLLDIIIGLDKQLFDVFLVCPRKGALEEKARKVGIRTFLLTYKYWLMREKFSWRYFLYLPINFIGIFRIKRLIDDLKIDLVYTNTCTTISGALASKICRKKHIWHIHESIGNQNLFFNLWGTHKNVFTIIYLLSNRIVVNSNAVKLQFPEKYHDKITVIYNGFDIKSYSLNDEAKIDLRKKYGIKAENRVISVIGSISGRKGQKNMISAMPFILSKHPLAKLIIAGVSSDPKKRYERDLWNIISLRHLNDAVKFVGFIDDISEIYKITDCLVVPSNDEPFGRVVVEAMLFGVPVIATKVGGIPEIIENKRNGILIESNEPSVIANAVIDLLNNNTTAKSYIEEAKRNAVDRFGMQNMVKRIEEIIRKV